MTAQAWKVYNKAKKKIGNGTILLNGTHFRMTLHTTNAGFSTLTLSAYGSLANEVGSGNGYSSSGKLLTSAQWTLGRSAKEYKFVTGNPFWSANGGSISNIKGAVIWLSGTTTTARHVLCFASLTSTPFALSAGNRLTIQMASAGVFTVV